MFKSYLKIAFRNLHRNKAYSFINIAGLAFGLLVSMIITFYVLDDITYDRFHQHANHIYRMLTIEKASDDSAISYAITSGPLMVSLNEGLPEIVASSRVFGIGGTPITRAVDGQDPDFENAVTGRGIITDPLFFDIVDFKIIAGEGPEALEAPNNVFLTPELAEAIFGDEDPLGKALATPNMNSPVVAGLIEKPPVNSHLQFDFIAPLHANQNPVWWDSWENLMLSGYVRLQPDSDLADCEKKLISFVREKGFPDVYLPRLQPLLDVHLGSAEHRYDGLNQGKNDRAVVYALTVIGILVLLIAAINFINLSTARATQRAREVGLRKVVGSDRTRLNLQFQGKSTILTLVSMTIALLILEVSKNIIVDFLGKQMNLSVSDNPMLLLYLFIVAVGIGILSGFYPALVLSGFDPITVLRGKFRSSKSGVILRRVLVIIQFTATISLIAGVLIVRQQIIYLRTLDLGYNREQVITIFSPFQQEQDLLREELNKLPGILGTGRGSNTPGPGFLRIEVVPEGFDREESRMFQRLLVDEDFVETMEIKMIAGRDFSREFSADSLNSIIINETAMQMIGWTDAIGKRADVIEVDGNPVQKRIIGVMKDVHFSPTRQTMEPMMFQLDPRQSGVLYARIAPGNTEKTIGNIEDAYGKLFPDRQFNFQFLDDIFDRQFRTDREFAANMTLFSGIAIFIACLGLLGLVSYTVSQRRQEIAVRKVLGCSVRKIVALLAVDFLKWVLIANLAAWPLSYFAMNAWLRGFVYQVPFSILPYILAGITVLLIAAFTLSYQAITAALRNPIDSIRYE